MQTEKRVTTEDNSFTAGGIRFVIHSTLNVIFYEKMEELLLRARYGKSYRDLMAGYSKWVELKNAQKPFDADVHLRNVFEGVVRGVNKQFDPVLLICTLFCWPEGVERKEWSEESANETLKIWSDEGIPVEDFFALALRFVRRYSQGLEVPGLDTSQGENK